MHTYIFAYIHIYVYIYMHTYELIYVSIKTYMYTYICMNISGEFNKFPDFFSMGI